MGVRIAKDLSTGENQVWFDVPVGDALKASLLLVPQSGRPVVAEVRVSPLDPDAPPEGGITARELRRLRLDRWREEIEDVVIHMNLADGRSALAVPRGVLEGGLESLMIEVQRRPGPGGRPDDFYARLAALYLERSMTSKRPVLDLAREMGRPVSHIRQLLATARERRLLTAPDERGAPGGRLTDKATRLVKERM